MYNYICIYKYIYKSVNILKKPDARLDLMCDLSGTITDNYKGITWQLPWGKEVSQPTET